MSISIILCAFVCTLVYIWRMIAFYFASWKMKGPIALPLIGNALHCLGTMEDIQKTITRMMNIYGTPLRVWLGTHFMVFSTDPQDFKIVLNSYSSINRSNFYDFFMDLVGDSILTDKNISRWRHHRKLLETTFSANILNSFIPIFNKNSQLLCNELEKMVGKGVFDVKSIVYFHTLNSILETAMGVKPKSQSEDDQCAQLLDVYTELMMKRITRPWYHLDLIFKVTKDGKRYNEITKGLGNYTKNIIEARKLKYKENKLQFKQNKQKVFLDYLLDISEETGQFTDVEIFQEVLLFLSAGSHSSALSCCFTLMLLGMHPEIQDKVYNEIQPIFNDSDENIKKEDLNNLSYLHRVIKESLRLFPFSPLIGRTPTEDLQLNTCFVPKGTDCMLSIFDSQRDPKLWSDPLKFDPDRFLPDETQKRHPYSWIPFSAGPRNCIGLKYAMMSLKVMLVHIIRKYKIFCDYKRVEDIKIKSIIYLAAVEGYPIALEARVKP